jgi:membrane protein DedA with SNARE-associated domain
MFDVISDVFDWLKDFSSSPWFYAVMFAVALLDSVLPIVPSETLVIVGGVSAGLGDLNIVAVIACGAAGAVLGDNLSYSIGRRAGPWVERRSMRKQRDANRLAWAKDQITTRGGPLLVTARFIPGGRTVLTLTSGITAQSRAWFMRWAIGAGLIWATYAALLGYIGGTAFEDNHTAAFLVAFAMALSVTVFIEIVRHIRVRRLERRLEARRAD